MATIICRQKFCGGAHFFHTTDNRKLCVTDFRNGIATIVPVSGEPINSFVRNVAGCFKVKSNFKKELFKAFGYNCGSREAAARFKGVYFEFNGAKVLVDKQIKSENAIYAKWCEEMNKVEEKQEAANSSKTLCEKTKPVKQRGIAEFVPTDVIYVDETTELEFKNEEAANLWNTWAKKSLKDSYNNGVITYARRWAKYMQHLMNENKQTVAEVAKSCKYVCDIEGITAFMYGMAIGVLFKCWKYGEELKIWHNRCYGYNDIRGVINPATVAVVAS